MLGGSPVAPVEHAIAEQVQRSAHTALADPLAGKNDMDPTGHGFADPEEEVAIEVLASPRKLGFDGGAVEPKNGLDDFFVDVLASPSLEAYPLLQERTSLPPDLRSPLGTKPRQKIFMFYLNKIQVNQRITYLWNKL